MTDTPAVNDIPAILARASAATEGPWFADVENEGDFGEVDILVTENNTLIGDAVNAENAEFIAHSRTDVPNMAKEILSLRAQVEEGEVVDGVNFGKGVTLQVAMLIASLRADKKRLDWLDEKREDLTRTVPGPHGEPREELHGHAWGVYGQHLGVRDAIDEDMEAADATD